MQRVATINKEELEMKTEFSSEVSSPVSTWSLDYRGELVASLMKQEKWKAYTMDALSETAITNKDKFIKLLDNTITAEQFSKYLKAWIWEYFKDTIEDEFEREELLLQLKGELNGHP